MRTDYRTRLDEARSLADIFEVVKALVEESMNRRRGGLMLGMANLGNDPQGFLGGFFTTGTNVIVLNKIPLQRIMETRPELYRPYVFHVLLHEYIHSLGCLDESEVKKKVHQLTREALGEEHLATQIAASTSAFIKHLAYPHLSWKADDEGIELVKGFDRSSVSYIA